MPETKNQVGKKGQKYLFKNEVAKVKLAELFSLLNSSNEGLTGKEALLRLKENGLNVMKKGNVNALVVLGRQFRSSLIYLLLAASAVSYLVKDYSDGTIVLAILLINTLLGFVQEYRSEKVVEKLSKFITKQVRVKRDGEVVLVDESQVVVGDALVVRQGDVVSADLRLFEAEGLQVNESQLTGESVPLVKKAESDTDKVGNSLVFAGSMIEKGEGIGTVFATGNNTELGKIAMLSTKTKKRTQYEKSLESFSSFLVKVVLLGLALIFIFKIILNGGLSNMFASLFFVIAMAVAVVPEVLPVIASVALSVGVFKLAKKHVVVRRLSAVEDFGNIDLLCTDKTGTITENKMTVKGLASIDSDLFQKFAYASITYLRGKKKKIPNSYDQAFADYIPDKIKHETADLLLIKELPFDPDDRRSRVVIEDKKNKNYYLLSLGAPQTLLEIARSEHKEKYLKDMEAEGRQGLRHFGIAYKQISYSEGFDMLKNENELTFLGYASLYDPLRPTAKNTIQLAEKLGVNIKILTGDAREVAEYVGKEVGLVKDSDKVYLGSELDKMSKDELHAAVRKYNVFARITPTQKYDIINILKETNVVGYQGDGINDALALKAADVAIAVDSATDVAKENADVVLLNKNLGVVIDGIQYGRSIFVNINKYIKYTMVSNFGNFIALAILYLVSAVLPILPVQVLLTTIITDIPLIMISSDTVEDTEVVRPEKHNVRELMFVSLILGIPTALFELFYFLVIRSKPQMLLETSLYLFFTFLALAIFYSVRSKRSFWKEKAPPKLINTSFLLGFVFSLAIVYVPQFQRWFSFMPLPALSVALIVLWVAVYFVASDFIKVKYYNAVAKSS